MGIILSKEDEKDAISKRINADLREKAAKAQEIDEKDVDFAEDSDYVENYKKTGRYAWIWIIVAVLMVAGLVVLWTTRGGGAE